jgi:hypothetical protein
MNRQTWLDWRVRVLGVLGLTREHVVRTTLKSSEPYTQLIDAIDEVIRLAPPTASDDPIPMRLVCEDCGNLHIDEGPAGERPHGTHACQYCGLLWRPSLLNTVGVRFLPGCKNEPPPSKQARDEWFRS